MAFATGSILFPETPFTMFGDHMSPAMYQEDSDMRISSSSLSSASGPSAPSSAVGSPRSHHDMLPAVPEWPAPQCLSVSPNIVNQGDFFTPGEYSYSNSHLEEFTHFEFPQPKSFVGMFEFLGPFFALPLLLGVLVDAESNGARPC